MILSRPQVRQGLAVALAVLPLAFLILLVSRCYVDVPFWDEWEVVNRIERFHAGLFSFRDLWGQHNEHRPLFGVAVVLLLVGATRWNIAFEIAANLVVGVVIMMTFAAVVRARWPAARPLPAWLWPVLSLLLFSPGQWENWLWGWQITIFLNVLAVLTGLALMARLDGRWLRLAGAMACGVVATYSLASGLAFWMTGAGACALDRTRRVKPVQMLAWIAVGGLTIASYFYEYAPEPAHPTIGSNFAGWLEFQRYLEFFAKYCAGPVAIAHPDLAGLAGWLGIALFVGLIVANRDLFGTPLLAFTITCGVHAVAVGAMAALGRSGLGANQALVSRYLTLSMPLWLAIVVLAAVRLSLWRAGSDAGMALSVARSGTIYVAVAAIVVGALSTARWGTQSAERHHALLEPARRALIVGQDDQLLLRLYPDAPSVRLWRESLIARHLSVFRSARAQRTP